MLSEAKMDWKRIFKWALIVFFASILFHLAEIVVEEGLAELDRIKWRMRRAKWANPRIRHFTPEEVFSASEEQ